MDQGEHVQVLFAIITALLEDANEIAVLGQAKGVRSAEHRGLARRLARAAREVEAVSVTVQVLLRQEYNFAL